MTTRLTAREQVAQTHQPWLMERLEMMLEAVGVQGTDQIWEQYLTAHQQKREQDQTARQQQGEHYITVEAIRDPECRELRQRVARHLQQAWTTNRDAEDELKDLAETMESVEHYTLEEVNDAISNTVLGCGTASSEWFENQHHDTPVYDLTNKLYGRINNLWQYCA